jgi:hypothetical protein
MAAEPRRRAGNERAARTKPKLHEQLGLRSGDALLVVDVQRDFLPGGSLPVPGGDDVIAPQCGGCGSRDRRPAEIAARHGCSVRNTEPRKWLSNAAQSCVRFIPPANARKVPSGFPECAPH